MATITTTIRYASNLAELTNNLRQGRDQIETTTAAANRMTAALGGDKLIRAAHNAVAAIDQVGGVSKLTTQEQERLLATLDKSILKMERMGTVVPAAMRQTADALREATSAAEKKASAFDRVDGALGKVGLSIRGLGVAGLVTGLVSIGRQAVDAAGQIVDLADKTKLSTTAVQQYGYAAKMSGGELTQWADAVFKLGVNIDQGGTKVRNGLSGLGLEYERIKALAPEQQFDAIMRALASVEGPQERNRLGVELMGKGYANVAAAVDEYVQLIGEAPVASEAAVRATDAAADAIGRLWENVKTGAISAIGSVIIAVEETEERIANIAKKRPAPAAATMNALAMNPFAGEAMMAAIGTMPSQQDIHLPASANIVKQAEDLRTFAQRAADAQRELGGLSAATRAQIDAGLKLGESMETLGDKFGLSTDAQRLYATVAKAGTTAQTDAQRQAERHAEALGNVAARLTDLTSLQRDQINALLAAGVAERDIAATLKITERHVQLVTQAEKARAEAAKTQAAEAAAAAANRLSFLTAGAKVEEQIMKQEMALLNARNKQTVDNLLKTAALEQQVLDLTRTRSMSAYQQQVYQIDQWAQAQKDAFRGSAEEAAKYYALIDRLAALKKPLLSEAEVKALTATNTALGVTKSLIDDLGHGMSGFGRIVTAAFSAGIQQVQTYIGALRSATTVAEQTAAASQLLWGTATLGISMVVSGFSQIRAETKAFRADVDRLAASIRQLGGTPLTRDEAKTQAAASGMNPRKVVNRSTYIGELERQLADLEAQAAAAEEQARRVQDRVAELLSAVDAFGGRAPAALHPFINELLTMNGLTAEQQLLLSDLLDEPGWREMEEAAKRLGVEISSLGPAFAQQKLSEQALQTVRDLKFLEEGGADMNAVIRDSAKHIQELVDTAMRTGGVLPETLRPYIQKLIDMELLLDPNGELIRNIDQLQFADIEDEALQAIKGILEQIRDLLAVQIPNAARTTQRALDGVDPPPAPPSAPNPQYDEDGTPRAHRGAMVTVAGIRRFHAGVPRLAADEVPAILQEGEAVIRKSAVEALGGARTMAMINRGVLPQGGGTTVINQTVQISAIDGASVQKVVESREFAEAWRRAATTNTYGVGTAVREVA